MADCVSLLCARHIVGIPVCAEAMNESQPLLLPFLGLLSHHMLTQLTPSQAPIAWLKSHFLEKKLHPKQPLERSLSLIQSSFSLTLSPGCILS